MQSFWNVNPDLPSDQLIELRGLVAAATVECACAENLAYELPNAAHQAVEHWLRAWHLCLSLLKQSSQSVYADASALIEQLYLSPPKFVRKRELILWHKTLADLKAGQDASLTRVTGPQVRWVKQIIADIEWRLDAIEGATTLRSLCTPGRLTATILIVVTVIFLFLTAWFRSPNPNIWLSRNYNGNLITYEHQDWGRLQFNLSVEGNPLSVAGKTYAVGLGIHADSTIVMQVRNTKSLSTISGGCAIDDETHGAGEAVCRVRIKGQLVYESPMLKAYQPPTTFSLPLNGADEITLEVVKGATAISAHVDWVDLLLK